MLDAYSSLWLVGSIYFSSTLESQIFLFLLLFYLTKNIVI